MLNILVRSAVFWALSVGSFSLMGAYAVVEAKRSFATVMALFLPIWVSNAVLMCEHQESPAFLRTLPLTDRQVVRIKFGVAFGAMLAYAAVLAIVGIVRLGPGEALALQLKVAALSLGGSLLLAAACYIGMWGLGPTVMTVAVLALIPLDFLAVILVTRGGRGPLWPDLPREAGFFQLVDAVPWYLCGLAVVVAAAAFWGLLPAGIRVRTSSKAHL